MPQQPIDDLEDVLGQLASAPLRTDAPGDAPAPGASGDEPPADAAGVQGDAPAAAAPPAEPAVGEPGDEEVVAALASEVGDHDLPGAEPGAGDPSLATDAGPQPESPADEWDSPVEPSQPQRPSGSPAPRASPAMHGVHFFYIPVCFLFATITLVPAVLGVLILLNVSVPLSDRGDAKDLALIMQGCWPLSIGLFAGGAWYLTQYHKAKERAARQQLLREQQQRPPMQRGEPL